MHSKSTKKKNFKIQSKCVIRIVLIPAMILIIMRCYSSTLIDFVV